MVFKKFISLIVLYFVGCTLVFSQGSPASSVHAYQGGEELRYALSYGFVTGGYVDFIVKDTILSGAPVHQIVLNARTSGFVDVLFKLRDRYVSYVDVSTDQPLKSVRDIKEGKYRYYNEVLFDYSIVEQDSMKITSQKSGVVNVPTNIQDILSAFYYARKYDFNDAMKAGDVLSYTTYFGDEIFSLKIKYIRTEIIETKYGKMECYLFHPVTEVGRMFKDEEDMEVWISRDENRIPIKVKVNLKVGSFSCELETFKGLRNAFHCIRH